MDYKKLLFNIDIPSGHTPAEGMLLVSEPFLHEKYFNHSVILLADYEKHGTAMGVVLNNETNYSLQELISDVTVETPIPVYCGGPLADDHLFFLHTFGDLIPETRPVCEGLWLGGDFDAMRRIVNDGYPTEGNIRFFLGYSGWSERQLDGELENNVWAVSTAPDPHALLRGSGDSYWHERVRAMGADYRGWLYHPQNPMNN